MIEEEEEELLVIGKGEGEAGLFKEDKKTIVLVFRVKSPSDDDGQNSFERTLFISGIDYEIETQDYDKLYIMNCKSTKQLNKIIPAMESIHKKRHMKSKILISDECKEFFGE